MCMHTPCAHACKKTRETLALRSAEAAALGAGPRPEAGREPRSDAPPPCGACLGLRQPGEWLGWGWPGRLEAALGGGGDVGDPVQLALVLPPALAVRQAALARWARAHGVRGARAPGLPELRAEVGRALAALVPGARPPVGGGAGAGAGPSARVVLLVEAQHRGTRAEWVPVAPPAGTGGGRGRRGRGRKRGPPGGTAGTGPPPAEREAEAARLWAAVRRWACTAVGTPTSGGVEDPALGTCASASALALGTRGVAAQRTKPEGKARERGAQGQRTRDARTDR